MATKGWIDFPSAAAMIMGENIGTTITANLAAIPANIAAKRAAFAHFMFNVFGVIWMLFVFKYFVQMVEYLVASYGPANPAGISDYVNSLPAEEYKQITTLSKSELPAHLVEKQDTYLNYQAATSYGLTLFHTMFNICNVMIMIWFVNLYEKFV